MRKRVNILLSLALYIAIIALFVFLAIYYVSYSWVLLLAVVLLTILTGCIIFLTNRLVDVKLSWIMVTLCLPILGIFLYWIFGRPYHYRKKQKFYLNLFRHFYQQEDWTFTKEFLQNEGNKISPDVLQTFRYTTRISFRPIYTNTSVQILTNGPENFAQIIADLKDAKHYIFMNYFLIGDGELLEVILKIFEEKVKSGVKIYIIYDHVGSYFTLSRSLVKRIKKTGVAFYRFSPVRLPFLTGAYNFRNHRKDIVIDGKIGYSGGINLADNYIHSSSKYGFWRDTQVRLVGDAVKTIELIFRQDINFITRKLIEIPFNKEPHQESIDNAQTEPIVQIIDDGPLTKETVQKDLFVKFIASAKSRVWITSPYLVPTGDLITALRNSAYSGVDVRLCLPGISDKLLSLDLSRTYYDLLLEAGVKIYEYNHVFNHSKMGLFDDEFTIIGSTNLDYRSLYSDHQTIVCINDQKTNQTLSNKFEEDFKYSELIKKNPLLKRNKAYYKVFLLLFRLLAPLF